MNTTAKLGIVAAAVVVAAFLGIRFLLPGPNIGTDGPTPTRRAIAGGIPQWNADRRHLRHDTLRRGRCERHLRARGARVR